MSTYYQKTRERQIAYSTQYYQKHRERLREYHRVKGMQRYYEIKPLDGEHGLRCKGLCRDMDTKSRNGNMVSTHLKQGYKICRECNCMILEEGFRCPCCKLILSTRLTRRR